MQHTLEKKLMNRLDELAKKYEFEYDFITDFDNNINFDKNKVSKVAATKTNPNEILPNCKTVVVLTFKYESSLIDSNIASFAWGEDYHTRIKDISSEIIPLFKDAVFLVDGTDLNERYFANKSKLGFIGKNSLFISEKYGSYCNIALVLTSEEIISTSINSNIQCGDCKKCIDACPGIAIGSQIDCNKCIAEKLQRRDNLDFDNIGNNIYGCEVCQKVCPHNIKHYSDNIDVFDIDLEQNLFLTKADFKLYKGSPFYWIGYRSFIRNVHVAYVKSTGDYSKLDFLENSNSEYLKEVAKKLKGEY